MRTILTTLLLIFVIATDIVYTLDDDVFKLCAEGEFYDDDMEGCEPCSTCKDNYYVRQACSTFKNTVCGWCGSSKPVKNRDFYKRCHVSRRQDSLEEKHFEKDFRERVMASIMKEKEKHMKVNDEAIEKEQQHPDRRRLPPLPTDEYDDEYLDQDDEKYDVPASEEDLEGLKIVDHAVLPPMINQFYEDEDKDEEKHEKHDFAPISGDEFLRRDDSVKIGDGVKYKPKHKPTEDNDDVVKPVYVNEAKIGQENEEDMKDSDELSEDVGGPISVVAIAVRENAKEMEPEEDYEPSSSFPLNCHFIAFVTYMICFLLLLALVLKRCFKSPTKIPVMNFNDEQCAMMYRCAHSIPKTKEAAIYDNDIAYV